MSENDIVERLGCLIRAEGGSRDHGLPEIVSAMRDARAEIERLRAALRDLIDAIDCSPSRLPPAAGPQEIGAQYRAMVYRVSGHHVEKAREALGE